MTDVFISYSKDDRAIAEALAAKLAAKGLTVWWDTELVGGESFRDAIEQQLEAATVVTVLWSPSSIKSRYVIDEADVAAAPGKLVSVLVGGLSANRMPMGFRTIQSVPIDDDAGIDRALRRRGLKLATSSSYATSPKVDALDEEAKAEEAWKFIRSSHDGWGNEKYHLYAIFRKTFPNSKYAKRAALRRYWYMAWLALSTGLGVVFIWSSIGDTVSYFALGLGLFLLTGVAFQAFFYRAAKKDQHTAFAKFMSKK
jgi:hypothetical protein